jgi:molybdopterin-binding protein
VLLQVRSAREPVALDERSSMTGEKQALTPREASEMLGISYPSIKKWILNGTLKTIRTPGGHHRIPISNLNLFLASTSPRPAQDAGGPGTLLRMSGNNLLKGTVASIRSVGLMSEIVLAVEGSHVTAMIPSEVVKELALKAGDSAIALIKSTDVMISR